MLYDFVRTSLCSYLNPANKLHEYDKNVFRKFISKDHYYTLYNFVFQYYVTVSFDFN